MTGKRPLVIGIAGGTGSGKTTFANAVIRRVGAEHVVWLAHDLYYRDLNHIPLHERRIRNFDHPDSLDTHLLVANLRDLRAGRATDIPRYDFREHRRLPESQRIDPRPVILLEGILIFAEKELLELLDFRIFIDTASDVRFIRRLRRDIEERGRTMESVMEQYLKTVRPMHLRYVEPNKGHADILVPRGGFNERAVNMVADHIRSLLAVEQGR
ncbi:MAG: uridine kinase [Anaerolineaceae bacterium]|nr:uridine kinase [Anaerolineaceae bacterium]MDE0329851.1 uridine kinase [Anaerolineaceae bacterium]